MIVLTQTAKFKKKYKKLTKAEKVRIDEVINNLVKNPNIGQPKKGDLKGILVYKFKFENQQKLIAYVFNKEELTLISLGTHENFYRDLKKITF